MNVIVDGHEYELECLPEGDVCRAPQKVDFVHKEPNALGNLETVRCGTTNEEVLAMLIHRLKFLSEKLPSRETSIAITKCEEALMWLEKRTAGRKSRGVENTREK